MVNLGNRLPRSQKGRLTCKCKKNKCEQQLRNGTLPNGSTVYLSIKGSVEVARGFQAPQEPDFADLVDQLIKPVILSESVLVTGLGVTYKIETDWGVTIEPVRAISLSCRPPNRNTVAVAVATALGAK